LYSFEPDGTLRPSLVNYFKLIGRLMVTHGWAQPDSSGYGYYNVRLKESLRREVAPVSTSVADSVMQKSAEEDDDDYTPPLHQKALPQQTAAKKPGFFQRLFGKKDTTSQKPIEPDIDTVGKTKKQIRQEKRALRKLEKQRIKELHEKGLM
jgi:hypothetical protein